VSRTGEDALIDWLRQQPDTSLIGNDAPMPLYTSRSIQSPYFASPVNVIRYRAILNAAQEQQGASHEFW